MNKMGQELEEKLERWADLAETEKDIILDKTEEVVVTSNPERQDVVLKLAPYIVEGLEQRAKVEGKSIDQIVERWLTEKLFIEKLHDGQS